MSARKKVNSPIRRKQSPKKAKSAEDNLPKPADQCEEDAARRRLLALLRYRFLRKWEDDEWTQKEQPLREKCFGFSDFEAVRTKINSTLLFLTDRDVLSSAHPPWAQESVENRVRRRLWMDANPAIQGLLRGILEDLLWVVEYRGRAPAAKCAEIVINVCLEALNNVKRLCAKERCRELFREIASKNTEFPSIVSLFAKENSDFTEFILDGLKLGAEEPFRVDPRKTYTPYTVLAMQIVRWINFERHNPTSLYRKIVPELDKLPFLQRNIRQWEAAIGFHLDFFQAPVKRRKKTAWMHNLVAEYEQREAQAASAVQEVKGPEGSVLRLIQPGWISSLWPWGEITKIPEFEALLSSGNDKNARNPSQLYNRVRHKVIDAALALMPE